MVYTYVLEGDNSDEREYSDIENLLGEIVINEVKKYISKREDSLGFFPAFNLAKLFSVKGILGKNLLANVGRLPKVSVGQLNLNKISSGINKSLSSAGKQISSAGNQLSNVGKSAYRQLEKPFKNYLNTIPEIGKGLLRAGEGIVKGVGKGAGDFLENFTNSGQNQVEDTEGNEEKQINQPEYENRDYLNQEQFYSPSAGEYIHPDVNEYNEIDEHEIDEEAEEFWQGVYEGMNEYFEYNELDEDFGFLPGLTALASPMIASTVSPFLSSITNKGKKKANQGLDYLKSMINEQKKVSSQSKSVQPIKKKTVKKIDQKPVESYPVAQENIKPAWFDLNYTKDSTLKKSDFLSELVNSPTLMVGLAVIALLLLKGNPFKKDKPLREGKGIDPTIMMMMMMMMNKR